MRIAESFWMVKHIDIQNIGLVRRQKLLRKQTTEVQENQTVVQQGGALLVEESMPDIRGVLVVASGADSAVIQERLLQAAATVLQLSREKIIVLPGEGGMDHA